jgi:alpha-amylase
MQIGNDHNYFNDETPNQDINNRFIIDKVSEKSYLVTNAKLLQLLNRHEDFKLSLSISGTLIDQLQQWRPDVLESFQRLTQTGRVEILAETYYHSLAFFYSRNEFEDQVAQHKQKVQDVFNQDPQVFRNTELSYNNDLAYWADNQGYKGIITEGWDPVLGWRSPNFVYQPTYTQNIKLLMKNYRLSDDIAFRFSDHDWPEWPLTADKFVHWLESIPQDQPLINLFMDYETFGEHQWHDTGIFEFLDYLPDEFMKQGEGRSFMTISEAIDHYEPVDRIDVPQTITWADTERDLTAWLGNTMQQQAIGTLYDMRERVLGSNDNDLIYDWRRLQTSDHFYYMCTKWFKDGDVHAYFSPYSSPYEAFMNFMNALHDIEFRLVQTTSR